MSEQETVSQQGTVSRQETVSQQETGQQGSGTVKQASSDEARVTPAVPDCADPGPVDPTTPDPALTEASTLAARSPTAQSPSVESPRAESPRAESLTTEFPRAESGTGASGTGANSNADVGAAGTVAAGPAAAVDLTAGPPVDESATEPARLPATVDGMTVHPTGPIGSDQAGTGAVGPGEATGQAAADGSRSGPSDPRPAASGASTEPSAEASVSAPPTRQLRPRVVPGPPPRPRPGPVPRRASTPTSSAPAPAAPVATPTPVAQPSAVAQPSPVGAASADPGRWGRADAEGVVHVRTADGERVVGSWQAGAPEEGLAHFARRFDDVRTEVELLAARLAAGGGDPKQALSSARTLRDGLAEATIVGDLAGLAARLDEVVAQAEAAVGAARSARDAQRAEAVARKEALAVEAETLADEATQWKQAGDQFTAILDEWRTIRGIDRKTDEQLWKRFSKAREGFNRRRGSHFADLDRQRTTAKARKEELVVEAEKLADSDDWGPTAARYRDLMTEWKAAGRAQKDTDDSLWQRFRTAQDGFFARRSATFTERDAEFVANSEAKKALLTEAERIDVSDPPGARAALRGIQARWEDIGKIPRDDIRTLEARLRAVEEKVREAGDRQWRRTDPEAEARVAQFRERVAQFEAQAEKARAAGKTKRAEEADAQAAQWREWAETAEQAVQHR